MKKLPKVEIISFILRSNKTYQITFQDGVLIISGKIVWQQNTDATSLSPLYRLKLKGTGPQNFRQKVKMGLRKGRDLKLVV